MQWRVGPFQAHRLSVQTNIFYIYIMFGIGLYRSCCECRTLVWTCPRMTVLDACAHGFLHAFYGNIQTRRRTEQTRGAETVANHT